METQELMLMVQEATAHFHSGLRGRDDQELGQALRIGLEVRHEIDGPEREKHAAAIPGFDQLDGGLNAFIFNCMRALHAYDGIIPYLERTLNYLDNGQDSNLWRLLGLLYLAQERNLEKACTAWRRALELNPHLLEQFPGLNLVYMYQSFVEKGTKPKWDVIHVDLDSGEFSVSISP